MSWRVRLSRRRVLAAVLALVGGSRGKPSDAQDAPPNDRGIGGTGAALEEQGKDRGIGGTGVIGTIQRFGSIEVNGLRITFPRSVQVRIDGKGARLPDLKVGHVVQVLAHRRHGVFETRRIAAWSEVVGPVESRSADQLQVLGQRVLAAGVSHEIQVGNFVAVSGLRRIDGTIVPSLVEPRAAHQAQVAGVPQRDQDGVARIGALPLLGVPPELVGRRVLLVGSVSDGAALRVDRFGIEPFGLLTLRPARFSIEAYVALQGGKLELGSGLPVESRDTSIAVPDEEVRAVISATLGSDGGFVVQALRPDGGARGSFGNAPQGAHPIGPPPGGPGPPQPGGPPLGSGGPPPGPPGSNPGQFPSPGGSGGGPPGPGPSSGGSPGGGPGGGPSHH